MEKLTKTLELIKEAKQLMISTQNYEIATKLRDVEKEVVKKIIREWTENVLKNAAP